VSSVAIAIGLTKDDLSGSALLGASFGSSAPPFGVSLLLSLADAWLLEVAPPLDFSAHAFGGNFPLELADGPFNASIVHDYFKGPAFYGLSGPGALLAVLILGSIHRCRRILGCIQLHGSTRGCNEKRPCASAVSSPNRPRYRSLGWVLCWLIGSGRRDHTYFTA
jgi:hypothetical protein